MAQFLIVPSDIFDKLCQDYQFYESMEAAKKHIEEIREGFPSTTFFVAQVQAKYVSVKESWEEFREAEPLKIPQAGQMPRSKDGTSYHVLNKQEKSAAEEAAIQLSQNLYANGTLSQAQKEWISRKLAS